MKSQAIIIGDSFNNTLGLVRSLGEKKINQILILVGNPDRLFISKSKYLKKDNVFQIATLDECIPLLLRITDKNLKQVILCTNDAAACFVDQNEEFLNTIFITPMSGKKLGNLMNKSEQCLIAKECGFDIPEYFVYHRDEVFKSPFDFPIILKPLYSTQGEKSDIHICQSPDHLKEHLRSSSKCNEFIVQEFIVKDYEINLLGVSTDFGVVVPGGVQKMRHYPTIYSPCSFGKYQSINKFGINIDYIKKIMDRIGYRGLFSIEFLRKGKKSYFMEINFRNDGLAYTATAAGANLPAIYMSLTSPPQDIHVKDIYMMDLSLDYCHVKDRNISLKKWAYDFYKTQCQLNYNSKDLIPTFYYYVSKMKSWICS